MKFKSIAAICKEDQMLVIYEKPGRKDVEQWIGTASALYPISGVPKMGKDGFCNIFDIPEKARDEFSFVEDKAPEGMCFDDTMVGERPLGEPIFTISSHGRMLRFLPSSRSGILCLDERYLAPLSDVQNYFSIHERITSYGQPYFALKMGFLLLAIIMPYDIIKSEFVMQVEDFGAKCRGALELKGERARTARQYAFDPETGEIMQDSAGEESR